MTKQPVLRARLYYANGFDISILLLALNHHEAATTGGYWPSAVFMFPFFAGLCLAGIVDPSAPWAIGKHGEHLPLRSKLIGAAGALVGLASSALLLLYYNGRL